MGRAGTFGSVSSFCVAGEEDTWGAMGGRSLRRSPGPEWGPWTRSQDSSSVLQAGPSAKVPGKPCPLLLWVFSWKGGDNPEE